MGLPLVMAGAAVLFGVYKRYRNEQQLRELTSSPGDAYRLPKCCIDALRQQSSAGTVAATIGAAVSIAQVVGTAQPQKPSKKSVTQTAKSAHDYYGLVMMDWEKEAALHAEFMAGIVAIANIAMFKVVSDHYSVHARENDTQAQKFWTRLYEAKKARLPPAQRSLEEAYDSIDSP